MDRRRKKRKNLLKNMILIALIYFAYRYFSAEEVKELEAGMNSCLQGEWQAITDGYEVVKVVVDEDSLMVYEGNVMLCDEEYSLNERTYLITGAYRQDFDLFALFEYRAGESGAGGKSVLVGNTILADGGAKEVHFRKVQTGSGRLWAK